MSDRVEHIDVSNWTDAEWIAAMQYFPPDAKRDEVERWVAERRAGRADLPQPPTTT